MHLLLRIPRRLRHDLLLRKRASMRGVGRGTTDQALALDTTLLPSGAQQQQGSATIDRPILHPTPVPGQCRVRARPERAPKPTGRERSALWRRGAISYTTTRA